MRDAGVPEETAAELVLAVNEACENAIEHPVGRTLPEIEVTATLDDGWVVVAVVDHGHWRQEYPVEGRGFGLPLMSALADYVDVFREPDRTELRLRRQLSSTDADPPTASRRVDRLDTAG